MAGWVKAVLFLFGGVGAAAGTAYVTGLLDPWLAPPAVVAPALQMPPPQPAQTEAPAATGEPAEAAPEETVTTPKQDRLAPPVFDLLRVEPDGSVLVAGKAGPQALVEVLSGETVLGQASAGEGGDFVVVLEDPLAPGDYRIALRATGPGGEAVLSAGTAIVSIPETKDGQVLAMVEEPGAPAQLITVPQAPAEAVPADAAPADAGGEEQAAAADVAPEPEAEAAAPETAQAGSEADEPAPAVAEAEGEAPVPAEAAQEQAATPADATDAAADEAKAEQPAATHTVAVEAVEIEGGTIFVAGRADAGRTVRVYADAQLLGDAVASDGGRFLVEARRELAVGNYLIRADLLGADGSVVARAAVPFEREPGESIAAVAPATPAPGQPAPAGTTTPEAKPSETADAGSPSADADARPEAEAEVTVAPAAPATGEGATAAPLQRVDGAVIIRRGDSLWRISRRVYGHGIRYSTIYLANQDQIHDPDRIWPGQVFSVPNETPEGEKADMGAIGDQAVKPEDGDAAGE